MSLLLITADPGLQAQVKQASQETMGTQVTIAKDWDAASRVIRKGAFDIVILETKRDGLLNLSQTCRAIDPSRTFILAGSRAALQRVSSEVLAGMLRSDGNSPGRVNQNFGLEDYIESKLGDFVKGMKNGSARNLHRMLIKAVECPLISLVLEGTNGNQAQAAHLLGINRNTLRKKITEFSLPLKRGKNRRLKQTLT